MEAAWVSPGTEQGWLSSRSAGLSPKGSVLPEGGSAGVPSAFPPASEQTLDDLLRQDGPASLPSALDHRSPGRKADGQAP